MMSGSTYKHFVVVALLATQLVGIAQGNTDDGPIDSVDNAPKQNYGSRCRSRLSKCETNIQNLQQQLQELQVERNQVENEKIQEINTRVRVETAIKLMTFRLQHPGDPVPNFRPHIFDPEPPTFYEAAFDNTVTAQCVVQLPRCHKNLRSVQKLLQMQKEHVADGRRELEDLRRLTEDERDKARVLAPRLNEMLQSRYEAKYGPINSN